MIECTQSLSSFRKANINSVANKYDCFLMNDYIFKKKNIFVLPRTTSQIATFDLLNHFLNEDYIENLIYENFVEIMRENLKSIMYSLILLLSSIIGIILTFNLLENPRFNIIPVVLIFTTSASLIWLLLSVLRYFKIRKFNIQKETRSNLGINDENYTIDKEFLKLLIFKHLYEKDMDYDFMVKYKEKLN